MCNTLTASPNIFQYSVTSDQGLPQFTMKKSLRSNNDNHKEDGDDDSYLVNKETDQDRHDVEDEDYEFPDRVIIIPSREYCETPESIEPFFGDYDAFYNTALGDNILHCRPLLQPLTPIPETSEYSTRSSIASVNPFKSWQSSDLSPSESFESRSGIPRRLLYPYIQSNRLSHESFSGPEKSMKNPIMSVRHLSSSHSEPDRIRRSYESHSLESGGHDCNIDLASSLRTHSSRSSLAEFLRLETSCDGSRGDLCDEEEEQLTLGQQDLGLQELVHSIQQLQKQHLDEPTYGGGGLVTLASADGSSSSPLALGSDEIDRRIGETIRNIHEEELLLLSSSSVPLIPTLNCTSDVRVSRDTDRLCISSTSLNAFLPPKTMSSTSVISTTTTTSSSTSGR
ncbi:unnamed protein product [Heterobilharzia americana]|nr:unnamed protein product [Heterobilharzia americana]